MIVFYALIATLAMYAMDWTVYSRIGNIISISRPSKNEDDPDQPYKLFKIWRPICAAAGGLLFLASEFAQFPAQGILYAGIGVAAAIMALFTYVECTSR